jgi:hypothetical protein
MHVKFVRIEQVDVCRVSTIGTMQKVKNETVINRVID